MATRTIIVGAIAKKANRDGYYGVKIDNTDTWLNFEKEPTFQRGAEVKVVVDSDRVVSKFKVLKEGKPQSGGGRRGGGGGGGRKPDPEREARIVSQHSQEMGIAMAKLILENDAEKLGAKTKPAERKAAILSLIDEMTARAYTGAFEQSFLKAAKDVEDDLEDEDEDLDDEDLDDADNDEDEDDDLPWE